MKATSTILALLLLVLVLQACAASDGGGAQGGGEVAESGSGGGSMASDGEMESAGIAAGQASGGQAADDLPTSGGSAASATAASGEGGALPEDFDRKIVKTAEIGLRAEDVRESAERAQQVVARFDGTILSSRIDDDGGEDSVFAELVLSVPSPEFEGALDELRGLGEKVTADTVKGQDVTEEYVDLESRERNLLAAEESLLKLYDRAEDVEDTLTVQRELTNVRGEIELVQGRLKYLDQRTANSQITLNIEPVVKPITPGKPGWSPVAVAADAWEASLGVLQGIATAAITAVVFGWWILPLLIAGLVWWRRRGWSSRPTTGPSDVG